MKRLISLTAVVVFLMAIPLSHQLMGDKPPHSHHHGGDKDSSGSKEKTLLCHSDCFHWDGFYLWVKNVETHVAHGDTYIYWDYQIWNDDYCCDPDDTPCATANGCFPLGNDGDGDQCLDDTKKGKP
ncbi:hypothetical protein MYX84_15760 [Acidobacteria bacterium AH-259-O06]|nr:hypothetical protein [Acidobacteria bacterium AH-259-O06]